MRKCLLISHGNLAKGMANTLQLFLGENHPFHAISAYTDGNDNVDELIEQFMNTVQDEDELLICTDIMGGSVNQKMMAYLTRPKTYLVSGMNLPLLIQLGVLSIDEEISLEWIRDVVHQSTESIVLVNDFALDSSSDCDE